MPMDEIERIRKRFEIAVTNFASSAFALQANEKAFQAWYAASVIQEFGLSRVYREVHLNKQQLSSVLDPADWPDFLLKGNELFPDLSVSWDPAIDARHTASRPDDLDAGAMLREFSIVSEFKVTASTKWSTSPGPVRKDLRKLGLLGAAADSVEDRAANARRPSLYMVILDNHMRDGEPLSRYRPERMRVVLAKVRQEWPEGVRKPTTLVARGELDRVVVDKHIPD